MPETKQLAKKEKAELAPVEIEDIAEGFEEEDRIVPLVKIHQGDLSEESLGQHEKGTLVNSVTLEPIQSDRFAVIRRWVEWICWVPREEGSGIEYRERDRAKVPPEDLEWSGEGADRRPPRATKMRNFLVLFEGEDLPVVLSLKSSSKYQNKAGRLLHSWQVSRRAQRKGVGLYRLETIAVSNDKGKWYDIRIHVAGDAPQELAQKALGWAEATKGRAIETNVEQPTEVSDGNDTPF